MTASPSPPDPPLVRALIEVREILERARRTGDRREIEAARASPANDATGRSVLRDWLNFIISFVGLVVF